MTVSVEIKNLYIDSRSEGSGTRASIFAGTATVEISGLNGAVQIDVQFEDVSNLDAACTLVYQQLAAWGAEVAAVSQNAAGESS